MESAIRWSPSSTPTEQRFLSVDVTGKSFRLCKVTGFDGHKLRHQVLSTLTDVPLFRAFDWSSSNENLIAVGQSSGEATVLRLDADSKESLSFPVRNQRYCNAVAFSTHGLLASGLDRVRNDFCLTLWDVNQRLGAAGRSKGFPEPLRKLASSEPITSIKFFRDQPDTLVTGVKGQFVRIYDLRGVFFLVIIVPLTMLMYFLSIKRAPVTLLYNSRPVVSTIWQSTGSTRTISRQVHHPMRAPSASGIDV